MELDLHGIRHIDVRNLVIHFIEDNWDSANPCYIVTGYSPKMKQLVAEVLDEYKLDYSYKDSSGFDIARITVTF